MNNNIDEKLSALYDGELDANEIDEVPWVSYVISSKPPATIEPQ